MSSQTTQTSSSLMAAGLPRRRLPTIYGRPDELADVGNNAPSHPSPVARYAVHSSKNHHVDPRMCLVCISKKPTIQLRLCPDCSAGVCYDCIQQWFHVAINNGLATQLACVKCPRKFSSEDVHLYCPQMYKKYLFFISREEERDNPLAAWCPNENCYRLLLDVRNELSPFEKETLCPDCCTNLCTGCFSFAHEGEECPVVSISAGRKARDYWWEKLNTKKCPTCSVRIQKSGGCSHMRCRSCFTKFCWKCGMTLSSSRDMREDSSPRTCRCDRALEVLAVITVLGGVAIGVPVAITTVAVVGPPSLLVFMVLPKRKKESIKAFAKKVKRDLANFFDDDD